MKILKTSTTFLKVEYDKWLHLMAGYIAMITVSIPFGMSFGYLAVVAVAILKEIYDYYKPGSFFDIKDIYWTLYGAIPAIIVYLALVKYNFIMMIN